MAGMQNVQASGGAWCPSSAHSVPPDSDLHEGLNFAENMCPHGKAADTGGDMPGKERGP